MREVISEYAGDGGVVGLVCGGRWSGGVGIVGGMESRGITG